MEHDLPLSLLLVHGALEELILSHATGQLARRLVPALALSGPITSRAFLTITTNSHTVDAPVVAAPRSRYSDSLQSRCADSGLGAARLASLRLVCDDESIDRDDVGEVDWDSLQDLAHSGMDIHVGSDDENFLWE
ncbi:hypothetical protein FB451DRAFT_1391673 [Mycena latifolia]|nr:hypothetical protein FB451DRAFT_1391673 [Mycena latifolia]